MVMLSKPEGAAFDENDQADGDQYHRQHDMAPPGQGFGDHGAGGEKSARGTPHADKNPEHDGLNDRRARADGW